MQKQINNKLSFRTACLWILFSTLFVSGSATAGFVYYRHIKRQRCQQSQYNIVAIVQTTPEKERLKTVYLAELLNLSVDHPTNFFRFHSKEAKRTLTASPLITSAHIKKVLPGTIYVDYSLRKPVAYLLDYTNTVIDREAVAFPFKPFFTPKKLPEVYFGLSNNPSLVWGQQFKGMKSRLAIYLIDLITENCCTGSSFLTRVDVSNALADSYGQREIIVIMEDHIELTNSEKSQIVLIVPQMLRLSVDNYRQELANYLVLRTFLREKNFSIKTEEINQSIRSKPILIDLRIPKLAYVKL